MSRKRAKKKKRAIPLLPNLVTTMSLFLGFYSISFSLKADFYMAAVMILLAGFVDGLDGRVARATNTVSAFGKEYDSLSDLVSFGVAPAILVYLWQLDPFGRVGFLASFLFVASGALRLARFNSDVSENMVTFTGLPIPVAAASIASVVLLEGVIGVIPGIPMLVAVYVLSYMMVSNISYPSFKHITYIKAHPFQLLVAGVLLLVVVASAPEVMIFVMVMVFVVGGALWSLVVYLRGRLRHLGQEKKDKKDEAIT
ncbi:MAG: CDP-diacylglycerol--serine O-phosphatidyltransferase [Thermodesulfobacteriota bacterium]|nr:CDP-diacylglycerol--serine O-phosphatidyltransferase [Thermodesulfobacteriota bacterium]